MEFKIFFVGLDILEDFSLVSGQSFLLNRVGGVKIFLHGHMTDPRRPGRKFIIKRVMNTDLLIKFGNLRIDMVLPSRLVRSSVTFLNQTNTFLGVNHGGSGVPFALFIQIAVVNVAVVMVMVVFVVGDGFGGQVH